MRNVLLMNLLALTACTKPNPNRCCVDEADCMANNIPVTSTCTDGLVCRGNQCVAETCSSAVECESMNPYCVSGLCGPSCVDDTQCPGAGQDPGETFCVMGACVACRAGGMDCPLNAPVCDMGACRACAADADCPSNVCDVDSGMCVDESSVTYASAGGTNTAACTKSDPCSFLHAIAVAEVDQARSSIKLENGMYTSIPPMLSGPTAITIYGAGATLLNSGFDVEDGFVLRVRDLIFEASTISCLSSSDTATAPTVNIERSSWPHATDTSIVITACMMSMQEVTMVSACGSCSAVLVSASGYLSPTPRGSVLAIDRSEIAGGDPAIVISNYSSINVTNSVLRDQGSVNHTITFDATSIATSSVSFTTFHNDTWICPTGQAIMTSSNNIFVNDTVGAPVNTVSGSSCTHSYDLIKPQQTAPTGANNLLNMDPKFVNAVNNDFHLMLGSPAIDAADPGASDSVDYDGTMRPQGARRDIGAFEYH